MLQELFRIPYFNIPIFGYGVMLVVGFLAALQLCKFLARRSSIDPEIMVNAALIALVSGIIGARLSHVLENWSSFTRSDLTAWQNAVNMINIPSGGLTFYGGFLLAFPVTAAYGLMKGVPVRRGMDIVAPCLMIGLGFGRIGCFLNGCCYGAQCELPKPLSVEFPYYSNPYQEQYYAGRLATPVPLQKMLPDGTIRLMDPKEFAANPTLTKLAHAQHSRALHPAQLYSTITAWLIAGFLVAYYTLPHAPGRVFALMLLVEAPSRFILEMLRAEPPFIGRGSAMLTSWPPMSYSMVVSLGLIVLGAALWFIFRGPPDDLTTTGAINRSGARAPLPA